MIDSRYFPISKDVRIIVERRTANGTGGPALSVLATYRPVVSNEEESGRFAEVFRTDLFVVGPHFHVFIPGNERNPDLTEEDLIRWCMKKLEKFKEILLEAGAGFERTAAEWDQSLLDPELEAIESALHTYPL